MFALNDSQLLKIWEHAAHQPPARRSFWLLAGASTDPQSTGALSVGERDRRLLLLRRQLFGERIEGLTSCPACSSRVAIRVSVMDLVAGPAPVAPAPVIAGEYVVSWRLPTCADLAELADEAAPERIRARLLERCLLEVRHASAVVSPLECPAALLHDVCAAMAQADPHGEIRLELRCPECGKYWNALFDIGAFLWRELDVWARRLLRDIHCLAQSFGWSERDILSMSAHRRRSYLDLVGA